MKKSLVLACFLSAFALSGFAQSTPAATPAEVGAKLVAERDAAWLRAHSGSTEANEPMARHNAMHAKHDRHVKHAKRAMHPKHAKQSRHAMRAKQAKHRLEKRGMTNATPANPQ